MMALLERRLFLGVVAFALLALAGGAAALASQDAFAGGTDGENEQEQESKAQPGTLDDGRELLPQASISLEQAVAAARSAATGDVGEVDLEYYQGKLVFNVDIGASDVKVDASNGAVLGMASD